MFKTAILATTFLFAATASASNLRSQDAARFFQEKDALKAELVAWKQSEAGQIALTNGYYIEDSLFENSNVSDAQLERFFMTKLSIEQAQALNPKATFSMDSPFTLMSDEEFASFLGASFSLGQEESDVEYVEQVIDESDVEVQVLAGAKDWSKGKCVGPVKEQGKCSSCWAFSSVGALESAYCLKNGNLKLFSEQQVTSCNNWSKGCQGGWPTNALNYLQSAGGVCTAASYPYVSGKTQKTETCKSDQTCTKVKIAIQEVVKVSSAENGFVKALNTQPISVTVAAANPVWKQYKSGVVTSCPSELLDHAVLAVGYGTRDGSNFFKIKNSWSAAWGEKGFINLERSACGVTRAKASYPKL